MLPERARTVLAHLAVFEGAVTPAAAAAVMEPTPSRAEILEDLALLADIQLVSPSGMGGEVRFELGPLVRPFAQELLSVIGTESDITARHTQFFQERCRLAGRQLVTGHEDVAWQSVKDDWVEISAALDRAIMDGRLGEELEIAVDASAALTDADAAQDLRRRVNDVLKAHRAGEYIERPSLGQALIWSVMGPSAPEADGATTLAWTAQRVTERVALARATDDDQSLLTALEVVIRSLPTTLNVGGATAAAHEGLALAMRVGNESASARFESLVALAAGQRGHVEGATALAQRALARAQAVGDESAHLDALIVLSMVPASATTPSPDAPPVDLEKLLEMATRSGSVRHQSLVLGTLAQRALAAGDLTSAARWCARHLRLERSRVRWRPLTPVHSLMCLVLVAIGRGDLSTAACLHSSICRVGPVLDQAVPPPLLRAYQEAVPGLRGRISSDAYDQAAAAGKAMTMSAAVDAALTYADTIAQPPRPHHSADRHSVVSSPHRLSPREGEVLEHLASGETNKEIAAALGLRPKTVMHHSMAIYRKLGVRGRVEATTWHLREAADGNNGRE